MFNKSKEINKKPASSFFITYEKYNNKVIKPHSFVQSPFKYCINMRYNMSNEIVG